MFSRTEKKLEYKKQQKETKLQQCFKNMMEQISRLWIDLSDCVETTVSIGRRAILM